LADRVFASLVVSNVALAVALVSLVVAVILPGPPGPEGPPASSETYPPSVSLGDALCSGASNCHRISVTSIGSELPLWRYSVAFYLRETQMTFPPVIPVESGNLWISIWSGNEGINLNFTDSGNDGKLTVGDSFTLDHLHSGYPYAIRLLWAENGAQIQHATFFG